MKAEIHEEVIVTLKNEPGALAEALEVVAAKGVNALAVCAYAEGEKGTALFVPDHPTKAKDALKQAGLDFSLTPVVVVLTSDRPGAAAEIARKVADRGINIEYCYATGIGGGDARVVLRAADNAMAKEALEA